MPADWLRRGDEHHHWVVLWPDTPEAVLFDPNGPVRNEPYFQECSAWSPDLHQEGGDSLPVYAARPALERSRYAPLDLDDPWAIAAYDARDPIEDILREGYARDWQALQQPARAVTPNRRPGPGLAAGR